MKLLVNNIAIEERQIWLLEQSYNGVVQWPALKNVDTNDWAEYDGIEPDLTNPVLDSRKVSFKVYAKGYSKYEEFIEELLENGYNDFYFPELGQHYTMRLNGSKLIDQYDEGQVFSLEFTEDLFIDRNSAIITQGWSHNSGFSIDGTDLGVYGISVLEGTLTQFRQMPGTKQRLLINENSMTGAVYDATAEPMFREQDMQIKVLMRAWNVEMLMHNYYTFLSMLTEPSERYLYCEQTMEEVPFFYKSQSVQGVILSGLSSGLVGIEFTINICVIEREKEQTLYLVDDDGNIILMTDNDNLLKEG